MAFIHKFVVRFGAELVRRVHARGKQAAIFWGDHWIGVEPYNPSFQEIGIDINIGACEDGVALRRLADSPGKQVKEIRLYPYFFPDVFRPDGKPVVESRGNWRKIRRALFRKGIDRIGHGGYLHLALEHPDFVDHVSELCAEFRMIKQQAQGAAPYSTGIRVAVIDAWGAPRSWINHTNLDQKFTVIRPDTFEVAGSNALECLSGLPVEVSFVSLDELAANGIPAGTQVVLNEGSAGTAWSGGELWRNSGLATAVRAFVHAGGAFIGIGDPTACEWQGRLYQLDDVLGVQKETGQSINCLALPQPVASKHFVTSDLPGQPELGCDKSWVFPARRAATILALRGNHIQVAVNEYGKGRSVFLAGLPYSPDNSRLLLRSIVWAARQETGLNTWHAVDPACDVVAWPERRCWAAANAGTAALATEVWLDGGNRVRIELPVDGLQFWSMD